MYQHSDMSGYPDTEWQTPSVSEKFQCRTGRRPSTADSGDTGLGTTPSDSTEDFCSSSGSPSFQPIRTQVTIPTAHVMPSTAGGLPSKPHSAGEPSAPMNGAARDSSAKLSPLSSSESPGLDGRGLGTGDAPDVRCAPGDCLGRYRTLVNGLDHSLFPVGDQTRLEECRKFDMPAIEPTLNQSALLQTFYGDPRYRLQLSSLAEGTEPGRGGYGSVDVAYKVLPESKAPPGPDTYAARNGFLPTYSGAPTSNPHSAGAFTAPQSVPSQLWQQMNAKGYEARLPDRTCDLAAWQQQKQQLENMRLQMEQMQMLSVSSGQYPQLYPSALHQEGSKWDAVIKANESLLKEKELVIERQVRSSTVFHLSPVRAAMVCLLQGTDRFTTHFVLQAEAADVSAGAETAGERAAGPQRAPGPGSSLHRRVPAPTAGGPEGEHVSPGAVRRAQRRLRQGEGRGRPETGRRRGRVASAERRLPGRSAEARRGHEETGGAGSQQRQAHQQSEEEVPEGVGAEPGEAAAHRDA
ncbi:CEP85 protein, partial [Amia calva]|nr:CEP85 protein [Amia calva]